MKTLPRIHKGVRSSRWIFLTTSLFCLVPTALVFFLVGCGQNGKTAAPSPTTIGYVSSGLSGLAVKVMREQGFAASNGLALEFVGFANPAALNQNFFLGKVDVNIAAGANVIATKAGRPAKYVYFQPALLNSVSVIVKTNSAIKTLADLKGKRIAWYGELSGGGTGFIALSEKLGVGNPKEVFKMIQTSPGAEGIILERGEVDAIIAFEPIAGKLLVTGKYRSVLGPFSKEWKDKVGGEMEMAGMASTADWFEKNPETARKLVKSWEMTVDFIRKNIDRVLDEHTEITGLRSKEEKDYGKKCLPGIYVTAWGNLDQSIEEQVKVLKAQPDGHSVSDSKEFIRKP